MSSGKLVCTICGGRNYAGGLCHKHHRAAVTAGETIPLKRPSTGATKGMNVAGRLAYHSETDPETGCRNWTGTMFKRSGYGRITIDGKGRLAHRAAYEVANGAIPDGAQVLHRCDNRRCINTDHHFLGDHAVNMADRNHKDRQASQLTREQVVAILADARPHGELAAEYGVGYETVLNIRGGRKWTHVPRPEVQYRAASAKLSEDDVRAIRADPRSNTQIAASYGVTKTMVGYIKKRKAWKHVV